MQPVGDPQSNAGDGERPFGSRPLARLASLAAGLPAQARPAEASEARAERELQTPLSRALAGKIVISRESKGRAGKSVTLVRGIALSEVALESLAKELRRELGSGVRVEDGALVVQGALSERLAASLVRRGAVRIVFGN